MALVLRSPEEFIERRERERMRDCRRLTDTEILCLEKGDRVYRMEMQHDRRGGLRRTAVRGVVESVEVERIVMGRIISAYCRFVEDGGTGVDNVAVENLVKLL